MQRTRPTAHGAGSRQWRSRGIVAAFGLCAVAPLPAAVFTVDTADDTTDASPGDGRCADALDRCSLRAAVQETNALAGADRIELPAGEFLLSLAGSGEDAAASGDLDVRDDLAVVGAGAALTSIDAGAHDRAVEVHAGSAPRRVGFSALTLRNGRLVQPTAYGGAGLRAAPATEVALDDVVLEGHRTVWVWSGVALDIEGCLVGHRIRVLGNAAVESGETIYVHGSPDAAATACIELDDSEIRGNLGTRGGALSGDYARIVLRRSLVADNEATGGAGAFLFNIAAPARLENVTVSGNRGINGAIMNDGHSRLDIVNGTITRNGSPAGQQAVAGGILDVHGGSGLVYLRNTILAGNGPATHYADCNHANSDGGGNLLGDARSCAFAAQPGDQLDTDPGLGPLADHGGFTAAHAPGAAAIDRATDQGCPATDQRGAPRPLDGDGDGMARCDTGALELADGLFADGFDTMLRR
ncbi:choice-of-anchor Q domain-containing protein [Tahibacter caeni]|uniref:choice-of-anchor Q domain-containing protein n=1 Tax=Tahibacter caeni TaxID=1453545 RepID=UPI00214851E3|nr:choice-of-anchor Q domain-containing protein [Tahibacter caeni]